MNWQVLPFPASALGESPFWHPRERSLYWIDIPGREILRGDPSTGDFERWAMPQEPGSIAPAASGGLVIALRDGVYRAAQWGGALQPIHRFGHDTALMRFNDGKADPLGRFWAGTMFEPRDRTVAALHAVDCRSGAPVVQTMVEGATIANGLAWSPDARTVYWADTPAHSIWRWDWDARSNTMENRRVFAQFAQRPAGWARGEPGYGGRPDGAAVDAQGNYWCAMFEGACIRVLSPQGELLREHEVPVQCPTMPCFGGDDLRTLYVTSSRYKRPPEELQALPDSGRILASRLDTAGLPVNFFQD